MTLADLAESERWLLDPQAFQQRNYQREPGAGPHSYVRAHTR